MAQSKKPSTTKKPSSKQSYQVFVSHATADKWLAKTICEKLESVGAITFRDDRDIKGGDDIPDEIRKQIKRSKELLVLLTPRSVDRPWVLLEVGAAWGASNERQERRIIAILSHVDTERIPEMLRSKKALQLNDFDEYLEELRKRVHQ